MLGLVRSPGATALTEAREAGASMEIKKHDILDSDDRYRESNAGRYKRELPGFLIDKGSERPF